MDRQSMLISADWRVQSGGSGISLILPFPDVANPVFVVRSLGRPNQEFRSRNHQKKVPNIRGQPDPVKCVSSYFDGSPRRCWLLENRTPNRDDAIYPFLAIVEARPFWESTTNIILVAGSP